ncbi:MAG: tRNA lysidine(34) synthetase TilS [candidate division NC10 bacterium]|nr:tRNA lysidine(34) synthetase TilS [candidate division NC10 bacterium]
MVRVDVVGRVERALRKSGVQPGARLLAATSGGVDSMVLLDVLARLRDDLGFRLTAVHVHHGLRGKASERDAALVEAEAARRGVPSRVIRLDPATRPPGVSVQVWAREARYRALEETRRRLRAAFVLTAHQQNDQAETILLNLLRGTGPRGLAGIPPQRGRLLRPLLRVDRAAIAAYATRQCVPFREDASNRSEAYRRNRIRRRLLPLLAAEYNPRIVESLADLAERVREDDAALTAEAGRRLRRLVRWDGADLSLPAAALLGMRPALSRRLLQLLFQQLAGPERGLTRRHLAALLGLGSAPGRVPLPGGLVARRSGDSILLGPASAAVEHAGGVRGRGDELVALPVGRWIRWPLLPWRVRIRRVASGAARLPGGAEWSALLDGRILRLPLGLRPWRPGDRFHPLGAPGRKKLQDFFVDAKVPREVRGRLPLLLGGGQIACVVGQRVAEEFRWSGATAAGLIEVRGVEE